MYKVHTEVLEQCKKQLTDSNIAIQSFEKAVNSTKSSKKELYVSALEKLNKLYDKNEQLIKLLEDNYGI